MKNYEQLHILFKKYLDNQCNLEETQRLMDYFELAEDRQQLRKLVEDTLSINDEGTKTNQRIAKVVSKVDQDLFEQIFPDNTRAFAGSLRFWHSIAAAAAIIIVVVGINFFNNQKNTFDHSSSSNKPEILKARTDIPPGNFGATLTLGNGKKIRLATAANGELAKESGLVISKSLDGKLIYEIDKSTKVDKGVSVHVANITNTLSTAKGETYQIILPDGSRVYLNAASSLTYNNVLVQGGKRLVVLKGEGYFEIAKDKQHPFIVKTSLQEVEVLGTHFNISSYAEDKVEKTTLLEGSIALTAFGIEKVLKPGEQGRLSEGKINVYKTDTDLAIAWKNNEFVFESESIESLMKMVERWYNVQVIYVGEKTKERFSGSVSRFDNISKVLDIVESTGAAHFQIIGRKIYVSI